MSEEFLSQMTVDDEIHLTEHDTLEKSGRYGNVVIGKIVGYTIPKKTKVSRVCYVYVAGKDNVYRIELWKEKITDERLDALRRGNVVKITQLEERDFYRGNVAEQLPGTLSTDFQFSVCADSVFDVKEEGKPEDDPEYPAKSLLPLYWKLIPEMKNNDENIKGRFLLLGEPHQHTLDYTSYGKQLRFEGTIFKVADKSGYSAHCFIRCDQEDEEDKKVIEMLKKEKEILFAGGRAVVKDKRIIVELEGLEFMRVVNDTEKKVPTKVEYAEFVIGGGMAEASTTATPGARKRRSWV